MKNVVAVIIILCIIAGIVFYLYRNRKKGGHCAGCPYCNQCGR